MRQGSNDWQPCSASCAGLAFTVYYLAFLGVFAEGLGRAGRPPAGLAAIDEALTLSARTDERWPLPELLRIKGDLILREGAPSAAAAAAELFKRSIDLAGEQSALSWELRTAVSLAGLWCDRGAPGEARMLLASVYGRFTEGFASRDVIQAQALLGELG